MIFIICAITKSLLMPSVYCTLKKKTKTKTKNKNKKQKQKTKTKKQNKTKKKKLSVTPNLWIIHYVDQFLLRWPYCLTIIGSNFVLNDLLHQTLISYNGPWFTFPFMHIWWQHDDIIRFQGKSYFFDNSLFLKKIEPPIKFKLCKHHKHDNI